MIGTFSLIWFALMLEERVNLLDTPDAADNLMPILGPLLIGFVVSMCTTAQESSAPTYVPFVRITALGCSVSDLLLTPNPTWRL